MSYLPPFTSMTLSELQKERASYLIAIEANPQFASWYKGKLVELERAEIALQGEVTELATEPQGLERFLGVGKITSSTVYYETVEDDCDGCKI